MKMLREWDGRSPKLLVDILGQFEVNASNIRLIKYEALTPDSFIWFFTSSFIHNTDHYCIYAEDSVQSLEQVTTAIHKNLPVWESDDKYELVKVKNSGIWENSSPVKSASYYRIPVDKEQIMKHAVTSGFDFVFLGKSTKK